MAYRGPHGKEANVFHAEHGLFFERLPNGDIRVIKARSNTPQGLKRNVFDQVISQSAWASVVSSLSRERETWDRYMAAGFTD